MPQHMKNVFRVCVDEARNFFGGLSAIGRESLAHLFLKLQQSRRRFFSSLNAGLIVGVDVNERAIKAHRTFIKCN